MSAVGVLILFALLGAFISAKARSAGGAIVFSLLAFVLFIGTPVGQGLPGAVSMVVTAVNDAATPALSGEERADAADAGSENDAEVAERAESSGGSR